MGRLEKLEEKVYNNYKNNSFSRSFLYKILEFIEDYSIANTKNNFKIEERELLLWKAKLYYTIKKNFRVKNEKSRTNEKRNNLS